MFVRIDKDLSVNIGNIFSYKLSEDLDSYKLQVWSITGNIIHTIIYLKDRPEQMKLLIEFNNVMRDLTTNVDIVRPVENIVPEEGYEVEHDVKDENIRKEYEEQPRHIQEQMTIDDIIE